MFCVWREKRNSFLSIRRNILEINHTFALPYFACYEYKES